MFKRFTLRLPDELHKVLEQLARQEKRSLHSQIIYILAQYVAKQKSN